MGDEELILITNADIFCTIQIRELEWVWVLGVVFPRVA